MVVWRLPLQAGKQPWGQAGAPHPSRLAAGPEGAVAVSVELQSMLSAALRTGERETVPPEQRVHLATNRSDRGEDTKARQLRSSSHHYWENKSTDTPTGLSQLPHPHPSLQRTALGFHRPGTRSLTMLPHGCGALKLR